MRILAPFDGAISGTRLPSGGIGVPRPADAINISLNLDTRLFWLHPSRIGASHPRWQE